MIISSEDRKEETRENLEYPLLMESKHHIVLFFKEAKGVVLLKKEGCQSPYMLGEMGVGLSMMNFTKYKGEITLKNA